MLQFDNMPDLAVVASGNIATMLDNTVQPGQTLDKEGRLKSIKAVSDVNVYGRD